MTKKRTQRSGRGASAAAARADDVSPDGADPRPVGAQGMARRPRSISLSSPAAPVAVAMLSKNQQTRVDFTGGNDVFRLGEIYLNELSDLRVFELTNVKARRLRVSLKVELRKPFHSSVCNFQLENENLNAAQELAPRGDQPTPLDEFNHVPVSVVRASTRAAMCVENAYLSEGYNELFNHIATVDEIILEPHETKSVVFSMCTKLSSSGVLHQQVSSPNADSSEEERKHLNETSCLVLAGRFIVKTRYEDSPIQDDNQPRLLSTLSTPPLPLPDVVVPLHGQVCRSLLRLDVKELHFDDCIPGGSFVKDFTVWNRSEIPLLFQLVFSIPGIDDSHDLLTFTDYNSGYKINDKAVQAAAYGHVRIRVTYRPVEVGERFFEVHAQNLHDSRNIKILKIHAVTNKEHHREGLSIKEPNGSYFMSGSKLDFGDCYSGIPTSKTLLIKNATEAPLHVELTSDRPKEVTFELKLLHNRVRASRSARNDDVLSPNDSNDGSSRKGSLSPDAASKAAATFASFDNLNGYGGDSDDDGDDNEGELYDEDVNLTTKRLSFEDNPLGDADDADDDFEFDREPRPPPRSPPASPKARSSMRISENRRRMRKKAKRGSRAISRLRDSVYESGVDSGSICSSPERKPRGELRRRTSSIDDANGSNFLVETLDLPPGVERTILVWYCPMAADATSAYDEGFDSKACRLSKQTFRVSFRCFQIQGSWQQAQSRVYDRTLGKSIHVRARTCTSIVTVSPSILHMGDCNIGELKSSACVLTNHSELPTVVKPLVTSKVISTVPNDDITLGPKQSLEVKVEIIPRKINPNYSRLISVLNLRNRSNIPQVCVRSSNMDAHHVIYHSLFYKLLTPSKSAFLNFDQVATSSVGMQVFDLENITNAPLHLSLQTSDPNRVRLYYFRQHVSEDDSSISAVLGASTARIGESQRAGHDKLISQMHISSSSTSLSSQSSSSRITTTLQLPSSSNQSTARQGGKTIRRRRSFGCEAELNAVSQPGSSKRVLGTAVLKDYLSKKGSLVSAAPSTGWIKGLTSPSESVKNQKDSGDRGVTGTTTPPLVIEGQPDRHISHSKHRGSFSTGVAGVADTASMPTDSSAADLQSLLDLFDRSRAECDRYCHLSLPNQESENEIVAMIRERVRKFQALQAEGRLVPLTGAKDRNVRIPAKSKQRIVAVFTPYYDPTNTESAKLRVEKCKIFITLPPGGNKKAVADGVKIDPGRASWAIPKHPFDSRPSVRELLVKCRVCRSVLNVNQKNINFGRITVSSRSSKKLIVQNMSSIPLVYSVEKTGSISSAFLEIKDGEVGVVKSFGTKEISFEFQPTLAGPFEEKLKIVNVQDPENSLYVTIKARVVKRETFKLLQSGQVLSFGKCLVGEKSELIKIAVRNTSRKRREYAIQLDPTFSNSLIRPTVFFAIDDTPSTTITQAQEKKLDEELEKLEHKLRIAVTKKKTDKITKLNAKITRVRALLSGEQVPDESNADDQSPNIAAENLITELYDSNSESEFSEAETSSRNRLGKRSSSKQSTADRPSQLVSSTPTAIQSSNMLQFTLDPEAVGRVVAYAIFHPVKPATSAPVVADASHPQESVEPRSQRARKRQLKRDLAPLVGVGKLLLFEQQNKDVVKELQFNAEVFLRTPAGESAYYRGVGKAPLPPVPHPGLPKRPSLRKVSETDQPPPNAERNLLTGRITDPTKAQLEDIAGRDPALSEQREYEKGNVTVKIEQNQVGLIRHSTLMIPVEEYPGDTLGWVFTLTNRGVSDQAVVELRWLADEPLRGLLTMIATVRSESIVEPPRDKGSTATHGDAEDGFVAETLPLKVRVPCDHGLTLHLRWMYAPGSGFGSNTPITSSVNSSILDALSRNNQASAGTLEIATVSSLGETEFTSLLMKPVEVALVKAAKRTLHVETLDLDLGQEEQNGELRGQFIVHNRSRQSVKYLLLTSPLSKDASSTSSIVEISFDSSTGKVDPSSQTTVHFSFRCSTPGQHSAQILVRNLSDRLETLTVNVTARITRPVYVRIPELDPLATGTLNILDLGACYVTPEMQDTSVDSPNVSLKFSKTHKLTLLSQVSEDLILSASSNLKTQCYVYEDSRLYREATHVTLSGKSSLDLYVALRPRLPLDAFKSGAPRDLVGGIRVQLFRSNGPSEGEDKSAGTMVAEFTIKFVGVAGASLSRVNPSLVEFKMEPPSASLPVLTRTRTFEITNVSKALPLQYRLFVSHDTESYSDYDTSLVVNLLQSRGDIPPGESGQITFSVTAKASGLFRRRILVENLHYAGKIMSIDVVVFVENSVLICEVPKPLRLNFGSSDESSNNVSTCTANLGNVPVIQLEEDLAAICDSTQKLSSPELEGASVHRKYRIYSESTKLLESSVEPSHYSLLLTNTDESADLIVRPVSTLPLCFQWSGNLDPIASVAWLQLQPTAFSATLEQLQRLQLNPVTTDQVVENQCSFFYGGVCSIPAKSSRRLHFRFAPIAASDPLPVDTISSGRPHALRGLIAVQNFASGIESSEGGYARTLRAISLHGQYAESNISVCETSIALGKIGYSLGWRSSSFQVVVRNVSDISTFFAVGSAADSIVVTGVRNAMLTPLRQMAGNDYSASLLQLAAATTRSPLWKIEPFAECVIEMKFVQTPTPMTAGLVEFPLRIHNLLNPHNVEQVLVSAQIVSSYAEITVDPESSGGSIGVGHDAAEIGYLPPVTVPPLADSTGTSQGPSFWFSVKNVFDEELSVTVSPRVTDNVKSVADLLICSRSSNTLMSSVTVAPGESIDIRVVCRVKSSARISTSLFGDVDRHYNGDLLTFGSVDLDITVQNMKDAAQHKEILVRGKVVPGRTFSLSASNLHFYAVTTDVPPDMPLDQFPSLLRMKTSNRDQVGALDTQRNLYQLRTQTETFWIKNPSTTQPLNFAIDQVPLYSSGLCIISGSTAEDMCAMSEHIQAVPVPSSGSIPPGESVKVNVRLEEVPALNCTDVDSADPVSASSLKSASMLHKMRHHPSWRSNSWGGEMSESASEPNAQSHMFLSVRDVDLGTEAALAAEIDVLLVLQPSSSASGSDTSKPQPAIDKALLGAAFATREKRLQIPKMTLVPPSLPSPVSDGRGSIGGRDQLWGEGSVLDHFDEFDIGSIRSGSSTRQSQLPVLTVRGCTPAEHSTLHSTRYVIDVGQHTVRNGGEVEWEITIECAFNQQDSGRGDSVDYRLLLVDRSANSWFQLSRDRGTLDSTRSYQSVVMYFYRDVVGVYSTFLVLQNVTNPGDLKVIQVKLEVVADLSSLRSMTSGIDPAVNLFRVLVSSQSVSRKLQRSNIEYAPQAPSSTTSSASSKLIVDYGEVYYHKLYHNHSIVIENASSMALDFMLSSSAQNEISFSVSPTSFSEVTTVTLPARGRAQVFLHFRPRPDSRPSEPSGIATEYWSRELEVYVNCRLVKDFRETVVLRAICYPPQLVVDVASSAVDLNGFASAVSVPTSITQPNFLGMVFAMTEAAFTNSIENAEAPETRYLVVKNTRSDVRARIALRNDSLFFSVSVDSGESTQADSLEVDYLEDGICAGRRSTLLVSIAPQRVAVFRVVPDLESLRRHRQMWDHSVKEHITLYNIKQFAEHYQVTLCFTSSNVTSYYIPPHIVESYPFSALEDTIAKFLQNYHATWKWLISYHSRNEKREGDSTRSSSSLSATRLADVLSELEAALEQSSPLSPRKPPSSAGFDFDAPEDREALRQLLHSYRALYFDFFYITDELIWYGVRSNAVRQSLMLADLAYGVVFNHEIFRAFVTQTSDSNDSLIFPRLLLPWSRQLRHFLSFFPENQEAIRPLRQLYEQLQKFELLA